ncbi:hypothetical protein HDU92_008968, partial [Lobulomyces angularis]
MLQLNLPAQTISPLYNSPSTSSTESPLLNINDFDSMFNGLDFASFLPENELYFNQVNYDANDSTPIPDVNLIENRTQNLTTQKSKGRPNLGVRKKISSNGLKEMKEIEVFCKNCLLPLASLILHGTLIEINSIFNTELNCLKCHQTLINDNTEEVEKSTKKSKGKREVKDIRFNKVFCDCCKRHIAFGSLVKNFLDGSNAPMNSHYQQELVEVDFGFESICCTCRDKYGFCTECGGGAKFRTGKWRPLSFFLENKKTCNILHSRFGKATINHFTFTLPKSATEFANLKALLKDKMGVDWDFKDLVKELSLLYRECKRAFYGSPKFMEYIPSINTSEKLEERTNISWKECERTLMTSPSSSQVRYITIAYINTPPPRKKVKKATIAENEITVIGFVSTEIDLENCTLCYQHVCNRGITNNPSDVAIDMSKNLFLKILESKISIKHIFAFATIKEKNNSNNIEKKNSKENLNEEKFEYEGLTIFQKFGFLKVD